MLRTACHRLLAHPWWTVLVATAMTALAGGVWVALIAFILIGGILKTARNVMAQEKSGDDVEVGAESVNETTDPLLEHPQSMGALLYDPDDLGESLLYAPQFRHLSGNIWHQD